jgi:hypothetical protein
MADMTSKLAEGAAHGFDADISLAIQNRIRTGIAQTEARAEEARLERANRLADGPDPEPLARTLRRLRHDLAMLARILRHPFSDPVRHHLEAPLSALLSKISSWLLAVSKALMNAENPPDLKDLYAALEEYKAAVHNATQDRPAYQTGNDDTQRMFALLFIFEQMLLNLQDLSDRTSELAHVQREPLDDAPSWRQRILARRI